MQFHEALSRFPYLLLRLALKPQETLKLPAQNKGNTLRGAFGSSFRRLVCVPECRNAHACPLAESCPYKLIFEPSPPQDSNRLSKNQDIPRPFIFRPPLDSKTTYEAGEAFEFELVLLGTAVNYLPYFVLAFREVVSAGFGLNRARCELIEVRAMEVTGNRQEVTGHRVQATESREQGTGDRKQSLPADSVPCASLPMPSSGSGFYSLLPVTWHLIYSSADQVFHQPQVLTLGDYVNARITLFPVTNNLSPAVPPVARHPSLVRIVFLSPTCLRAGGEVIREAEFHHLFKRLRDRLNALSTFYGPGPIDADFKALGELAEQVRTVKRDVQWVERYRTSSKTRQRHELSGFVGSCVYNFAGIHYLLPAGGGLQSVTQFHAEPSAQGGLADLQSRISNQNAFSIFLPWLLTGELCHVGKHAAWGNGWYAMSYLHGETK